MHNSYVIQFHLSVIPEESVGDCHLYLQNYAHKKLTSLTPFLMFCLIYSAHCCINCTYQKLLNIYVYQVTVNQTLRPTKQEQGPVVFEKENMQNETEKDCFFWRFPNDNTHIIYFKRNSAVYGTALQYTT